MLVYTIGHSNYTLDNFLKLLNKNYINCIVDIRTTPYSKYTPQYNKNELQSFLSAHNIKYIHMGDEFGARRINKQLYTDEGYLDFDRVREEQSFLHGVERIKNGIKKGYRIALMCTEKDPIDCHRSIMVSKGLIDEDIQVNHILHDGSVETQNQLEKRLLDKYIKKSKQKTLYIAPEDNITEGDLIKLAYRKRNSEIAHKINKGPMY